MASIAGRAGMRLGQVGEVWRVVTVRGRGRSGRVARGAAEAGAGGARAASRVRLVAAAPGPRAAH